MVIMFFRADRAVFPCFFFKFAGYNRPELSKHQRRSASNTSREKLLEHATVLQEHAISSWIQQPECEVFKVSLAQLIKSLSSYAAYLTVRCKAIQVHHSFPEAAVNFSDAANVRYVARSSSSVSPLLSVLDIAVTNSPMYQIIHLNDFLPKTDRRRRYLYNYQ